MKSLPCLEAKHLLQRRLRNSPTLARMSSESL